MSSTAGQHSLPGRVSHTLDFKEHQPPHEGLRSVDARDKLPGSNPKSATYSTHVNFIMINTVLRRERRLARRGRKASKGVVWG